MYKRRWKGAVKRAEEGVSGLFLACCNCLGQLNEHSEAEVSSRRSIGMAFVLAKQSKMLSFQREGDMRKSRVRRWFASRKRRKKIARSWTPAVWSYLHAAMSLGKREHEIWTKGGSGRVNSKTA